MERKKKKNFMRWRNWKDRNTDEKDQKKESKIILSFFMTRIKRRFIQLNC